MLVSEVMTRELFTVPSHLTVAEGLAMACEREVHHLLIMEGRRLKGVACVCELRDRSLSELLRECVVRSPVVIWAQCSLKQAARRFVEKGLSCFPVCDGAELVGVITRGDLRRSVVSEASVPGFRCEFCGSTYHVRPLRGDGSIWACLDCADRIAPAGGGLFDEGTKD